MSAEIPVRLWVPAGLALGILIALDPFLGSLVRVQGHTLIDIAPYLATALLIALAIVVYLAVRKAVGFISQAGYQQFLFYAATTLLYVSALEKSEVAITLGIFLVVWLARLALGKERRLVVTPLFALTVLLMAWCTVTVLSPHGIALAPTATRLARLYLKLVMVVLVLQAVSSEGALAGFVRLSIVLALLSTVIVLGQIGLYYATGVNYSFSPPDIPLFETTPWGIAPRTTAFFNHPNLLGTQLSITLMILLYLIAPPTSLPARLRSRYALVLLFCMIAILYSFSRGTWVGMAVGALLLYYLKAPEFFVQKTLALALLGVILYATGVFEWAYSQMVSLNPGSVDVRVDLFQLGLQSVKEHPILGYGFEEFTMYSGNLWGMDVHSFPLEVASQTGAPGLLIYMAVIVYLLVRLGRAMARSRFPQTKLICGAFLVAAVAFLINNLFHQISWSNTVFHFFALQEAVCLIVERREREGRPVALWAD